MRTGDQAGRHTGGMRAVGRLGDDAARGALLAHDGDCGERLAAYLGLLPERDRPRFLPAARRAGEALELLKPGGCGVGPDGPFAGCHSVAFEGTLLIVASDPARVGFYALAMADVAHLLAWFDRRLADAEAEPLRRLLVEGGALPSVANGALEGVDPASPRPATLDAPFLAGVALRDEAHRQFLAEVARRGLIPAMICLVATDGLGAILAPFIHGRAFPAGPPGPAEGEATC